MAKDYAKKKTSKNRPAAKGNGVMWVFALCLTGLFILGLFYLKEQKMRLDVSEAQKISIPQSSEKQKPVGAPLHSRIRNTKQSLNANQPNLDFYTLLPKVGMPAKQIATPAVSPTLSAPINAPNQVYSLQLGVFNDYGAADELKAEVTLQGFEATISSFKKEGAMFYRLTMGPFKSKAVALQQQQVLAQNQIKSTVEIDHK